MKHQGFSLIEIMIAIVILAIGVFPFMNSMAHNTTTSIIAKRQFVATYYAKELIEEMRLKAFDQLEVNNPADPLLITDADPGNDLNWSVIPSSTSGDRIDDWNDVNDYNGYSEKGVGIKRLSDNVVTDNNYYRTVKVSYVVDKTLEETGATNLNSNTKKIVVKCYHIGDEYNATNEQLDNPSAEQIWYTKYEQERIVNP